MYKKLKQKYLTLKNFKNYCANQCTHMFLFNVWDK